jgi:hypothetical protein
MELHVLLSPVAAVIVVVVVATALCAFKKKGYRGSHRGSHVHFTVSDVGVTEVSDNQPSAMKRQRKNTPYTAFKEPHPKKRTSVHLVDGTEQEVLFVGSPHGPLLLPVLEVEEADKVEPAQPKVSTSIDPTWFHSQ